MIEKFLDNASDILLFGQDAPREFEDTWPDIRSVLFRNLGVITRYNHV